MVDTPDLPEDKAKVARDIIKGVVPNSLDMRIRNCSVRRLTLIVCRMVVSSKTLELPVKGAEGRLSGSVSWGIHAQTSTHPLLR